MLELLGVTAIMPFIEVVMNPESIQRKWYLNILYSMFDFQSDVSFMLFLAAALIAIYTVSYTHLDVYKRQLKDPVQCYGYQSFLVFVWLLLYMD